MFEMFRDKRLLAVVAAVIVGGFVASLAAFSLDNDPEPEPSATPSIEPRPSASPTPVGRETPVLKSTCAEAPSEQGDVLAPLRPSAWERIAGSVELASSDDRPPTGSAALKLDAGTDPTTTWYQYKLPQPIDLRGAKSISMWVRQNGNILVGNENVELRLVSTNGDLFARLIPNVTLDAAIEWCQDTFTPNDLWQSGSPDLSAIEALQLMVPGYGGAGVGNTIWWGSIIVRN
jgi:hypothetical protein